MEYNIEVPSDNQFTEFISNPYCCEYKIVVFNETEEGELYTLIDKTGQCPNGLVDGPIAELCIQNIKKLSDIELQKEQIKFWQIDDSHDIITLYYAVCIQNTVDERWLHIKELKEIPIAPLDYDLIKRLYKFVTKKDLE